MAITNQDTKRKVSGDGTERTFSFPFKIYRNEDITVQLIDKTTGVITSRSLTTHYSVSTNPISEGGTITFTVPSTPTANQWVFLFSNLEYTQNVVLPVDGAFREISVSNGLDRIVRLVQQVSERVGRAITFRIDSTQTGVDIPEPESDKLLGWNEDGDALENKVPIDADSVAEATAAREAAEAAQAAAEEAQRLAEEARDEAEVIAGWEVASQGEAEAGTDNTKVMTPLRVKQSITADKQLAIFNDTKDNNTNGGTFTSGAWRTRDLNTEVYNTISGSEFESLIIDGGFEVWSSSSVLTNWLMTQTGSTLAREDTIIHSGTYSAKITRAGTTRGLYQPIHISRGIEYWKGKTLTFGCWCKTSVAESVVLSIADGVGSTSSDYHTGGGEWEWLTVTHTVSASATLVWCQCGVTVNGVGYFDTAKAVLGDTLAEITVIGAGANQFSLPAGTYIINASAPAQLVQNHKAKLRNITDGEDTLIGLSGYSQDTAQSLDFSLILGGFTIAGTKVFEIQHQCTLTGPTSGFGSACNFSVNEIYTQVHITKVG